ncbi:Aspartyl/glutamyl-tRNA(Asn/Gln) amidotransferase subunit B [Planctopirus ephydatiae]|uniref:Aspartyl/glutamyl-tRNA(Asn/Gln) amidotransferase subunit B n=1 Tax=Planctopirus ephydatiae TaxID=2528019 RepID=A0A518GRA1_9PLAN|nr:Asp-tRNA(Asn)/Glu-tRNA(Gln) amidotransferase subunit GatB [Planctopirus ephydatiae]QDV31123.1 Aspartyl/glutamyl-tRNA(Asn/Gln) amidotransferase subunit B [Planctopirus ephydatiae]
MKYDVIIGLEVHAQLQTKTKIFCGCATDFTPDAPNIRTCPVCLGLPGALPVLNRRAFEMAVKAALGLRCQIAHFTKWDRKQYFYPDLPKGYQISQYDLPFSHSGLMEIPADPEVAGAEGLTRKVRIIRAHLEDDAGKNIHDESGRGSESQVDLNRAGTPLVEIVTEPDLRSPKEARMLLEEIRLLLLYLGVSDCNMQEGNLRCDANINLHLHHDSGKTTKTPIVEIKNLNSFRFLEQACEYEVSRQLKTYGQLEEIADRTKRTFGYDPQRGVTIEQRSKEEAADYRYFPDPDLVPVIVTADQIRLWQADLPERPQDRRQRYQTELGLSPYDAGVIIEQGRAFADFFEQIVAHGAEPKQASNWITQEIQRILNERKCSIGEFPVSAELVGTILRKVSDKQLTLKAAREALDALVSYSEENTVSQETLDKVIQERGLAIVQNDELVLNIIQQVIQKNPKPVADYLGGKQAAAGSLLGQVMREARGADPQLVKSLVTQALDALKSGNS